MKLQLASIPVGELTEGILVTLESPAQERLGHGGILACGVHVGSCMGLIVMTSPTPETGRIDPFLDAPTSQPNEIRITYASTHGQLEEV